MSVAEMCMLCWMCGHTRKDHVRNETIRQRVGVAPIEDKMRELRLRWFGHVPRRPSDAPVRRVVMCGEEARKREKGRPKQTWVRGVRSDMVLLGLDEGMALERAKWRAGIRVEE
ncbi:unnamed protein product [Cuscuta epithymum]|uniref:Uncharacterized protein n=1 Tax=Cuscuta epithymum TaxID=186058 RepID=A0AAV0DD13_9ASTE|nr:unnamed protein product [Cuscuta epithymum]